MTTSPYIPAAPEYPAPLVGADPDAKLYTFAALADPTNQYHTLNAADGRCDCHLFFKTGWCIHLAAAVALGLMHEGLLPPTPSDDVLQSALCRMRFTSAGAPLSAEEEQRISAELQVLARCQRGAVPPVARSAVEQEAARLCQQASRRLRHVGEEGAAAVLPELQALCDKLKSLELQFEPTAAVTAMLANRQERAVPLDERCLVRDNVHKPMVPPKRRRRRGGKKQRQQGQQQQGQPEQEERQQPAAAASPQSVASPAPKRPKRGARRPELGDGASGLQQQQQEQGRRQQQRRGRGGNLSKILADLNNSD